MASIALRFGTSIVLGGALLAACSSSGGSGNQNPFGGTGGGGGGGGIGTSTCGTCSLTGSYVPCDANGNPTAPVACDDICTPMVGCTDCTPGGRGCMGNEIRDCNPDGTLGSNVIETCDVGAGLTCSEGMCRNGCEVAEGQPSNIGCEFWAVDLDQQDAISDPASAPWGVVLSNTGQSQANVTIEINQAPQGSPIQTMVVQQISVAPGALQAVGLPTRELDCGVMPNDYRSPGTCLSSNAFRITSSSPLVVYQFNVFENAFSNDASLLLPSNALGKVYRVLNWSAGHATDPFALGILDRSYVTIVGTQPNTTVRVKPTWRVRGNPPIMPTNAGDIIEVQIGPFDVLNLETDDATLAEASLPLVADFSGTGIDASAPIAVFTGVESTSVPYHVDIPTYPGWMDESCCLDHLEEQLFPLESVGRSFVITRSPIRSTGSYVEPDVLRFVGGAAPSTLSTSLPPPFDNFTIQPGEVRDTWTDKDITVSATEPVLIGQLLISQGYIQGTLIGDPALTMFPPVEQYRTEYVFLTPNSWTENWVVISAQVNGLVGIDGLEPSNCTITPAGNLDGVEYESRRCPLGEGVHRISGDLPFGVVAYGYGSAGSYAFAGGADVKPIYEPPPVF